MATRFARLSTTELAREFEAMARDLRTTFEPLAPHQLNWRPAEAAWSVAQCLDHLVKSKAEMCGAMDRTLEGTAPKTVWQRLPLWPRVMGWLLITSQSPGSRQKFTAEPVARPSASDYGQDVVDRLIEAQHDLMTRVRALGSADAERIMVSPFVARITYGVLDGYRLLAAHQRRHFEQAVRVMRAPGFPGADASGHPPPI